MRRNSVPKEHFGFALSLLERIQSLDPEPEVAKQAANLERYVGLRSRRGGRPRTRRPQPARVEASERPNLLDLREETLSALRELAPLPSSDVAFTQSMQLDDGQRRHRETVRYLEIMEAERDYKEVLEQLGDALAQTDPAEWHRLVVKTRSEGSYKVTLSARRSSRHEPLGREERLRDMLVLHCGTPWNVADETKI
jgi:hypothetical protein